MNILSIIATIFIGQGVMHKCKITNIDKPFYRSESSLSQTKTYIKNGYLVKEHPNKKFGWVSISKDGKTFTMDFDCVKK